MTLSQEMEDNTLYTVEKAGSGEPKSIKFNLGQPVLFQGGFFSLMCRKRESGQSLSYTPILFSLSSLICPGKTLLRLQDKLIISKIDCILHASLSFSLCLFLSHKLEMQMWLCLFPINSSRQRVSSRSQPQFLYRTKITRGGESVRATLWQYSHSHIQSEYSTSIEISKERKMKRGKKKFWVIHQLDLEKPSDRAPAWWCSVLIGCWNVPRFGAYLSLTVGDLSLMNLTTVHGVDNKNFKIRL